MNGLESTIAIKGLPPHRGLIVSLCFFAVDGLNTPAPYQGDPPADAVVDCIEIFKEVDLDKESQETTFEHHFVIERSPGYYYVQLRVILFRERDGKFFAQSEEFFFAQRPVHITANPRVKLVLPVSWPTEAPEALHYYGTISPKTKRPWWRFW